ncbi:hypothetical protein ILYODFUR_011496 [Ilyodon furcidens]|uniref:Uncharacterized protein n=1 Tax=Ilyodon furcidens TaxID=33524 RepID=A0ABV0U4J2_9TELE
MEQSGDETQLRPMKGEKLREERTKNMCFHTTPLQRFVPCQRQVSGADHASVNQSQTLKQGRELYSGTVTTEDLETVYLEPETVRCSVNACWASLPKAGREDVT